ncbi:MAG: hypothetical protein OWS74_09040 [Firmicutes bacterium]|nr:hypothetical protein [Bacillota bacterium]
MVKRWVNPLLKMCYHVSVPSIISILERRLMKQAAEDSVWRRLESCQMRRYQKLLWTLSAEVSPCAAHSHHLIFMEERRTVSVI